MNFYIASALLLIAASVKSEKKVCSAGDKALIFASTPPLNNLECPNLGFTEACGKPGTLNDIPALWDGKKSTFETFWPPECGCFPPEEEEHPCYCVQSKNQLAEGFSLGDNNYKDRFGCYADGGPNPVSSLFDTTPWCFMKDDTTCPGAQPSLVDEFNKDGTRVNLPGMRVCGVVGDDCTAVGRINDSCEKTKAPLSFSENGNFPDVDLPLPSDTRLSLLQQLKLEGRAAFTLKQDSSPLNGMSMAEYIEGALDEFNPGPAVCGDVGNWNPATSESVQNIKRCQGNFVSVIPRSWVKSDPNPIEDDGYGSVKARAASLLVTIGQGEQAFPGELFNGREWTTLSGDSMVAATPSCATPGGGVESGTANYGNVTDKTGTKGGFPGQIWRPLADSKTGCCSCTPCLCSGKCLSQTAIGEGVQFAVAKSNGGAEFKGKLAYWFLTLAGELYLTEPVPKENEEEGQEIKDSLRRRTANI